MRIPFSFAAAALLFAVVASSFAADKFQPPADDAKNPPPSVQLNTYQRFELLPVAMDAPYAGQKGNEVAKGYLQGNISDRVGAVINTWNEQPAGDAPKTLKIEPKMTHVRFISGGKRVFAGGFAGSSWVYMTTRLTDAQTGEVVGEPAFFQRANGIGAAWTFGATDKTMLIRLSSMLRAYLQNNYDKESETAVVVAPEVAD
jgi:hypothetical protein